MFQFVLLVAAGAVIYCLVDSVDMTDPLDNPSLSCRPRRRKS